MTGSWFPAEPREVPQSAATRAPLVSIIIPCYNAQNFVAAAITSALRQTHIPCEIIVVDDGSTDDSVHIARSFADRLCLLTQHNQGAPAARNAGLAQASGEYIQFLDADDELFPDKIDTCLQAFSEDVDIVFTGYLDEDAERRRGGSWLRRLAYLAQGAPLKWDPHDPGSSALRYPVSTNAPLFRRDILRRVGGWNESIRNNQDIELIFRLASSGARFRQIDRPLVRVRAHDSPTRIRNRSDSHRGVLHATGIMHQEAVDRGVLTSSVCQALADRYARYGRIAFHRGDAELARSSFAASARLSRRPRPTSFPIYNWASYLIGLERLERWVRAANSMVRTVFKRR